MADENTAHKAGMGAGRSTTALIIVDFINPLDFPGSENLGPPALEAALRTASLKKRLAALGIHSIYANDNYGSWRSDFEALRKECLAVKGTPAAIARALKPAKEDFMMLKPRHSAFYATPLELLLHQMGAKKLIFAGLATDICVQMSAMDARLRGYKVWVPEDCTAAESEDAKIHSLNYLKKILKCATTSSTVDPLPVRRVGKH